MTTAAQQASLSMVKLYQTLFDTHSKTYGPDTCVFLMVGSFYELYCWITDSGEPSNSARRAMERMNIAIKDRPNYGPKKESGLWGGVPLESLHKFAQVLTREGWTVIVVDQVSTGPIKGKLQRLPARILSPGTHIETATAERMTMAVCVVRPGGLSASVADLTTGETFSLASPTLEAISHMFQVLSVKEVSVCVEPPAEPPILSGTVHTLPWNPKSPFLQPLAREEFLTRAFKIRSLLPTRSWLSLQEGSESIELSLCLLIQTIQDHFPQGADKLLSHEIYKPSERMRLGNNILEQINMITTNGKKSVLSLVERSYSAIGRRALRERILRPLADPGQISARWAQIAWVLEAPPVRRKAIEKELRRLYDLPRLYHKVSEGTLDSLDLLHLLQTVSATLCIVEHLSETPLACEARLTDQIKGARDLLLTLFDGEKALRREDGSPVGFLTTEAGPRCAQREATAEQLTQEWLRTWATFESVFPITQHPFTLAKKSEGEYIWQGPRSALKPLHAIQTIGPQKGCTLTHLDIDAKKAGPITLTCKEFEAFTVGLSKAVRELSAAMKEEVAAACDRFWDATRDFQPAWIQWLGTVDSTLALAAAAEEYGWVRPQLGESLAIQGLRHPLLELAATRAEYVKHSVSLGAPDGGPRGMLLYGVNASGKSSLMKALGIAVLLAQAGSFVPADSMTLRPYDAAFSRIWSHDNVWAGLSSFAVEVGELREILSLATDRSLVLGDEVCSGTESSSATALVAGTLEHLDDLGAHFVFATHLHDLLKVSRLLPRPGIGVWHLRVRSEGSKLLYDRTLQPGAGNATYGLEVARAMGLPFSLMERALAIRRDLEGSVRAGDAPRSSWNTQIPRQLCEICSSALVRDLEVHHITPRAVGGGNSVRNLVVLCERCHDEHHRGNLDIGELRQTSEGLERTATLSVATSGTVAATVAAERPEEEWATIQTLLTQFRGRTQGRIQTALEAAGISMTTAELRRVLRQTL